MAIDFFLKRAPQGWVKNFWGYTISNPEIRRLGPISLMQFCGIYPWVIAVQWISGGRPEFGWGELSSIEFLQSKIETKGQSRSYDPIPSLELLYLCQPKMDLPFRLSSTHEACNSEPL
jgi:hypothetical protein